MKRIGKMIGAAAVLGVGLLLLFAQTGKAADEISGLAAYTWTVSWEAGTSTWCFNEAADGSYSGDEFGVGNAHASSVTYDADTHVLAMEATSRDGKYVAQYSWTLSVDDQNLPAADNLVGSIVFSQPTPLTQTITITRGERRPAAPCDQPGGTTDNGGGDNQGAAAAVQTAQNGGGDNGGEDNGQQAGSQGGGEDDGQQAGNQGGGEDDGQQAGNQGGGEDDGQQAGSQGGGEDNGQQAGSQGGGEDDGQQAGSQGGGEDNGEQAGSQGGGEDNGQQAGSQGGGQPGGGLGAGPPAAVTLLGVPAGAPDGGGTAPVWCVMRRTGPNGNPEETVIRCDNMGGAGPGWTPVATNLTFAAASAMRDAFNAGNPAAVWCVMRRTSPNGNPEETVIRCDNMGGAGPGWTPVATNLTFAAASAMRDAFNAGNPAAVWCVMRRTSPNGNPEETVIRCDNMGGAGPGWTPVATNLTFAAASAMRDAFNAGNPAAVWCVMRRTSPNGNPEETVIRCDNMGGAGPGWTPVATNLTFAAASAMRDAFNAGNPAAVWCVMRRTSPNGNPEETVIRCDNMGGAGPGWTPVATDLTFAAASAMRDAFNAGD